jgi:hypothetical protein
MTSCTSTVRLRLRDLSGGNLSLNSSQRTLVSSVG